MHSLAGAYGGSPGPYLPSGEAMTAALPGAAMSPGTSNSTPGTGHWDWSTELQTLSARILRGRADEASAARRAAEEAERAALRRLEDSERRISRSQEEEMSCLQRFLAGWQAALESRFERQAHRLDSLETQLATISEKFSSIEDLSATMRGSSEETANRLHELNRKFTELSESLEPRVLMGILRPEVQCMLKEELQNTSLPSIPCIKEHLDGTSSQHAELSSKHDELRNQLESQQTTMQESLAQRVDELVKALGREVAEDANKREATLNSLLSALKSRLDVVEAKGESSDQHLAEKMEPDLDEVKEKCRRLEREISALKNMSAREDTLREEMHQFQTQQESRVLAMTEAASEARSQLGAELRRAAGAASNAAVHRAEEHAEVLFSTKVRQELSEHQQAQAAAAQQLQQQLAAQMAQKVDGSDSKHAVNFAKLRDSLSSELESHAKQLEHFNRTNLSELRNAVGESESELRSLSSACARLDADLKFMRAEREHGRSHEWILQRCLQRLRSLSLAGSPGLWLDSPEFFLASIGPLTLRLWSSGLKGGDGQCALAVRIPLTAQASLSSLPDVLELAVGDIARRAHRSRDQEEGVIVWFAESLGDIGVHTGGSDVADLSVRVQLPAFSSSRTALTSASASLGPVGAPTTAASSSGAGGAAVEGGERPRPVARAFSSTSSLDGTGPRGSRDHRGVPSVSYGASGHPSAGPGYREGLNPPTASASSSSAAPGQASTTAAVGSGGYRPIGTAMFGTAPSRYPGLESQGYASRGPSDSLRAMMEGNPPAPPENGGSSPPGDSIGTDNLQQPGTEEVGRSGSRSPEAAVASAAVGEPGSEIAITAAASPKTNPFDDGPAQAVSLNPFDTDRPAPTLAPAGASNAT